MKEIHYAYKISQTSSGITCDHPELKADRMVDILKAIEDLHSEGIFWVLKQFGDKPKEQLCVIDRNHNRIYFHYSGEVEDLKEAIERLDH